MPDYRPNFDIRGTKNGRSLLDEQQVRAIRARLHGGERQSDLANEYGVSDATISQIHQRRSWGWLPDSEDESMVEQDPQTLAARLQQLNDPDARKRRYEERVNARREALYAEARRLRRAAGEAVSEAEDEEGTEE
jgi:transposase-like protein